MLDTPSAQPVPQVMRYGIHDVEITIRSSHNAVITRFEEAGFRVNSHRKASRTNKFIIRSSTSSQGVSVYARAKPQALLEPDSAGGDLLAPTHFFLGVQAMLQVVRPLAGTDSEIHLSRVDLATDCTFPRQLGRQFIRSVVENSTAERLVMRVYCDQKRRGIDRFSNLDWSSTRGVTEWRLYDRSGVDPHEPVGNAVRLERQLNIALPISTPVAVIVDLYDADALVDSVSSTARFGTPSLAELQGMLVRPLHVDRVYCYFEREAQFGPPHSYPLIGGRRKSRNDQRKFMRERGIDPDAGLNTRETLRTLTSPWTATAPSC